MYHKLGLSSDVRFHLIDFLECLFLLYWIFLLGALVICRFIVIFSFDGMRGSQYWFPYGLRIISIVEKSISRFWALFFLIYNFTLTSIIFNLIVGLG